MPRHVRRTVEGVANTLYQDTKGIARDSVLGRFWVGEEKEQVI